MVDLAGNKATLRVNVDARGARRGARQVNRSLDSMQTKARTASNAARKAGLIFAGLGATVAGAFGIRALANFEQEMSTVLAVTNATEGQMRRLTEEAARLGATTRFTAGQAASGMVELARAGFTVEQVLLTTQSALNLAQAGALDLASAAGIAANAINAFGLNADQAESAMSAIAFTANRSATTVRQVGDAFTYVAPVSKALNVSLEETLAALGLLGNAGLQASVAGTALKTVLIILQELSSGSAGGEAKQAFKALGVDVERVDVLSQGLAGSLQALKDSGADVNDILSIFARRGAAGASVLLDNIDRLREFRGEIDASEGSVGRMARIMDENLNGAMLALGSALEAVVVGFGQAGASHGLVSALDAMTNGFRTLARNADDALSVISSLLTFGGFFVLTRVLVVLRDRLFAAGAAFVAFGGRAARAGHDVVTFTGALRRSLRAARGFGSAFVRLAGGWTGIFSALATAAFIFREELGLAQSDIKKLRDELELLITGNLPQRLREVLDVRGFVEGGSGLNTEGQALRDGIIKQLEEARDIIKDTEGFEERIERSRRKTIGGLSLQLAYGGRGVDLEQAKLEVNEKYNRELDKQGARRREAIAHEKLLLDLLKEIDAVAANPLGFAFIRDDARRILTNAGIPAGEHDAILANVRTVADVQALSLKYKVQDDKLNSELLDKASKYLAGLQQRLKSEQDITAVEAARKELMDGSLAGLRAQDAAIADAILNTAMQVDNADKLGEATKLVSATVENLASQYQAVTGELEGTQDAVLLVKDVMDELRRAGVLELIPQEQIDRLNELPGLIQAAQDELEQRRTRTAGLETIEGVFAGLDTEVRNLREQIDGVPESVRRFAGIMDDLRRSGALQFLTDDDIARIKTYLTDIDSLGQRFDELTNSPLKRYLDGLKSTRQLFEETLVRAAKSSADAMADFFLSGQRGFTELRDAARAFARELLSLTFQRSITGPLANALSSALTSGISGALGIGGASAPSAGGSTGSSVDVSSALPTASEFLSLHTGGFSPAGVPTYFHRDELRVPTSDGFVFNPRETAALMSPNVNVQIINSPGTPQVETQRAPSGDYIVRVIYPAVREMLGKEVSERRGTAFDRALTQRLASDKVSS